MDKQLTEDLNVIANSNLEIELLDGDLNIIQKLDDEPNDVGGLTSAQLKAKFDESGNIIKDYINGTLIPAVLADNATEADRQAAEAARQEAEQARVTAEQGRVSAETTRAASELSRSSAESGRSSAEAQRAAAEQTRISAENTRDSNEAVRRQNETTRQEDETQRREAETQRLSGEETRQSAETNRTSAEQSRTSAERNRVLAETTRTQSETERRSAEATRQDEEAGRVQAEIARRRAETARQTAETNRAETETARNVWEDYDGAKEYKAGNKVYWEGSSYVCLRPCTGITPADGTYWQMVARSGFTTDSAFGFDVVDGRLLCYYSGDNPPPFRLGSDGHLYVDLDKSYDLGKVTGDGGSGGGADIDLGITGASAGQVVRVKAVNTSGQPTAWETVAYPTTETWTFTLDDGSTVAKKVLVSGA